MNRNTVIIFFILSSLFYGAGSFAQDNEDSPVEFTGTFSDSGFDMDGNELFEHLKFDVELRISEKCDVAFMANLTSADGKLIVPGTLRPDILVSALFTNASLEAGIQTISIYFLGYNIRNSGLDGPYTVKIILIGTGGHSLGEAEFTSQSYSYLEFQGLLAQIRSVSDMGVDTDSVPGYNLLRIEAEIEMLAAGKLVFMCQLFSRDHYLTTSTYSEDRLEKGIHNITFDLPGQMPAELSVDGPYTVYLNLSDSYYTHNETYRTKPYKHSEFQRP